MAIEAANKILAPTGIFSANQVQQLNKVVDRASPDPDVIAFAEASGATDLDGLDALAKYLKGESLWDSTRIYPMKSSQNAGSGSTVYGLGGLTSNNMTLVNSPTWGSTGIQFASASSQYGRLVDDMDLATGSDFLVFARRSGALTDQGMFVSQWQDAAGTGSDDMTFALTESYASSNSCLIGLSETGLSTGLDIQDNGSSGLTTADTCIVGQWETDATMSMWINKSLQSLTRQLGAAKTSIHQASCDHAINTRWAGAGSTSPADYGDSLFISLIYVKAALTTARREAITDIVNDL